MVVPEYQRHSATVIALGAFGIANLDHMLSRENLVESLPASTADMQKPASRKIQPQAGLAVQESNSDILQAYEGRYEFVPGIILSVRGEGGKLYSQFTGQQELEMYAKSETCFGYTLIDAQISFVTDRHGRVTHLILHQNRIDQPAARIN